ncbi:MAG TPA: efflux RND transporter periplasmic adaptor subunit [Vicinamibacterales bacterium]|nr:efflux RND transporter periplasmic adaptor subunit [Vicinamibacterales bacterium]
MTWNPLHWSRRVALAAGAVVVIGSAGVAVATRGGTVPDVPTAAVARGDFVDYIQIRGEIKPVKSVVLSAPMRSGDLQIVELAKNGTAVKKGDVLVEFDGTSIRLRMDDIRSTLKEAEAEIAQVTAQARITDEQDQTAVTKAKYDLERAKLDLRKEDLISKIEFEQAKLAVADAEQVLKQAEAQAASDKAASKADFVGKQRKKQKAQFDLDRWQTALDSLRLVAPADGVVNILPNPRSGGPFGGDVEFREGDRAWSGANILELPDLSSIHVEAHLDESDRGRLQVGQRATVRIEAVPGRDFPAHVDAISVLARVDFSSGWPPARNFDLQLVLEDRDPRIRPGMSATARIAAERVPNVLLVPAEALFQHDGYAVVYRLDGSMFDERRVQVSHRGREQAAIAAGIAAGDQLATSRPNPQLVRRAS